MIRKASLIALLAVISAVAGTPPAVWAEKTIYGEIANYDGRKNTISIDPVSIEPSAMQDYRITDATVFEGGRTWDTLRTGDLVQLVVEENGRSPAVIRTLKPMKAGEMSALHQKENAPPAR